MKQKGFTLIELLAVIIILAVIALIATPIILNVVDNAKESARQSSIAGYADTTKLAVYDHMFGHNGQIPNMDSTFVGTIKPQGETVTCENVIYSEAYGVVLNKCYVGKVEENKYCFASGKTYADCNNQEFQDIYDKVNGGIEAKTNLISTLLTQYNASNTVGLLKDGENYYYKGTNAQVANNFVWYEGHLWRVIQINEDNTITMVTQQPITAIQSASSVWATQATYESSYINTWLNDVFYNSISDKSKIIQSTFNVGIYNKVSEITSTQYVGLLDQVQYTRAGLANSFLDIKDYFWLGNRYNSTEVRSVYYDGKLASHNPTDARGSRPVIKIFDLTITAGNGTLSDPFRESSKSTNTSNIKVGEYISVPGSSTYCNTVTSGRCLFRVVSKDGDSVKVILNGLLPTTSQFGNIDSDGTFSNSNIIYTPLTNFANSISTMYRYSGNKTFNIGMYENGQNYTVVSNTTYSGNVGLPVVGEVFSGNDIDLSVSTTKTFVNGVTIENPTISSAFWTMNAIRSPSINIVHTYGYLTNSSLQSMLGVRPVLYLNLGTNSNLTFTKGEGTAESPYFLGN